MDALKTVQRWLDAMSFSVATWNLEDHMNLVSQHVLVVGLPGGHSVDHSGWRARRRTEFKKRLLMALNYQNIHILEHGKDYVVFLVTEMMKCQDGTCVQLRKRVELLNEPDGKWRVTLEHILGHRMRKQQTA